MKRSYMLFSCERCWVGRLRSVRNQRYSALRNGVLKTNLHADKIGIEQLQGFNESQVQFSEDSVGTVACLKSGWCG